MIDPSANVVGASPNCFFGFDPLVAYSYFPKAGIRYVEVPAMPPSQAIGWGLTNFAPEAMNADDVRALKERLGSLDLHPVCVGAFCDLANPAQTSQLCARIDFAQQLGATVVIADVLGTPEAESDEWRRLVNRARYVGDYAADRGARVGFEIHDGMTRSGALALPFLEAIDHPAIGLNYDTGNVCYYNADVDPAVDIRAVADWIVQVHLKDTTGGTGEWQFCALGEGHVNFPSIVATLQSVGFRGPYVLEIEGREGEDLNREGHLQRIRESLAYLRRIGLMPADD